MTRNLLVGITETAELNAPRNYLVELLSELRALDVATQVAVFEGGPVVSALEPHAEIHLMRPLSRHSAAGTAQAGIRKVSPALARRFQALRTRRSRRVLAAPDCIHLHGAAAMPLLHVVNDPEVPVTVYVHPWDFSIAGLAPGDRRELVARTTRFLVADDSVVGPLLDAGVSPGQIAPASASPPRAPELPIATSARRRRRAKVGLVSDRPVVAILPSPGWSEMPDLTLATVWEIERRRPAGTVSAVWFGVPHIGAGDDRWPIDHEIAHMDLTDLELRAEVPSWDEVLELADLVILPTGSAELLPSDFAEAAEVACTPLLCWTDHPRAADVVRCGGTAAEPGDVSTIASTVVETTATEFALSAARTAIWRRFTQEFESVLPIGVTVP